VLSEVSSAEQGDSDGLRGEATKQSDWRNGEARADNGRSDKSSCSEPRFILERPRVWSTVNVLYVKPSAGYVLLT